MTWVLRTSAVAVLVAGVAAPGCGASQAPSDPAMQGDPHSQPSIECLPSPDVSLSELSERMRFAWMLAEQAFEVDDPRPPSDPTVAQVQQWADGELEQWLETKNELVEAARAELDAAAEEAHRQRIIAGALVGLLYEDVARVLLGVPLPKELERDPEIAKIYREIVEFQATPYLEHARRAYRACAANAIRPESMHHWSRFCAGRREQLPDVGNSGRDQGTVVTVSVE